MPTTFRSEERLVLHFFLWICNQTKYYEEVSMHVLVSRKHFTSKQCQFGIIVPEEFYKQIL